MSLLLANESAFSSWSERVGPLVALRSQQLAKAPQSLFDDNPIWQGIVSKAEGPEFERHGRTAVVKVVGALDYKYSFWSWLTDSSCYLGISAKVQAAVNDTGIDKIVLYCDSPGGHHHGLQETSDIVFAARESKEVVAVVDPEAASAGYWLASQATRIVGIESAWVGSVGSQIMLYSMKRMYDEAGIDIEVIRASISPKKNQGIPYEEISEAAREERQRWVDEAGETFIAHVERGRGLSRKHILDNFGQGMMFFLGDAIQRKMVDSIGSMAAELADAGQGSSPTNRRNPKSEVLSNLSMEELGL